LKVLILGNGLLGTAMAWVAASKGNDVTVAIRTPKQTDSGLVRCGIRLIGGSAEEFWPAVEHASISTNVLISAVGVASPALVEGDNQKYSRQGREIAERLKNLTSTNHNLKLRVVTSGGTIYGNTPREGANEQTPRSPLSQYGVINANFEHELHSSPAGEQGRISFLRLSNPYGRGESGAQSRSFVDAALAAAKNQSVLTIFGDGEQVRDFIHIDDVADLAVACSADPDPSPIALNVGSGVGHSLNEVIALIEMYSGRRLEVRHKPARTFDAKVNVLDISKAIHGYEFVPRTLEIAIRNQFLSATYS
jgi:UDP-glucose 4-epimerase